MNFINQAEPVYGKEEINAVNDYLKSGGWLMEFKKTREFEQMICSFTGAKHCSVVSNGTVSLFIALKALGIGNGDEVIVPDITMAATPNAVILAGAKPIFVDIEKESLCLDVAKVRRSFNKKTKAVLHVSLNGRAGELLELKKLSIAKTQTATTMIAKIVIGTSAFLFFINLFFIFQFQILYIYFLLN